MTTFSAKARTSWGDSPPTWIVALAAACDKSSQSAVAKRLDVNAAYLSFALANSNPQYHGRTEDAVRSRLLGELIDCPVLGEIPPSRCREIRRDRRRPLGPVRKQLKHECPLCPFNTDHPVEEAGDAE